MRVASTRAAPAESVRGTGRGSRRSGASPAAGPPHRGAGGRRTPGRQCPWDLTSLCRTERHAGGRPRHRLLDVRPVAGSRQADPANPKCATRGSPAYQAEACVRPPRSMHSHGARRRCLSTLAQPCEAEHSSGSSSRYRIRMRIAHRDSVTTTTVVPSIADLLHRPPVVPCQSLPDMPAVSAVATRARALVTVTFGRVAQRFSLAVVDRVRSRRTGRGSYSSIL